jgi:lysophospholipase
LGGAPPLVATPAAPVPPGAEAAWVAGARGARLRTAFFPVAGDGRGSVVLSGGRTETIEKYFEVVEELRRRGFAVLAHDWRGQGLSQRLLADPMRGHAEGYADFVADFGAVLGAWAPRLPRPWISLAHSMGGCLTALALAHGERRFSAAAFSAPMFGVQTGGFPRPIAKVAAAVMQRIGAGGVFTPGQQLSPIDAPFEDNFLTHDRRRYERNRAQLAACPELALGGPTWGWLAFAFRAMGELERGVGITRVDIPMLVVAAGDEQLVDVEAARRVTERMPDSLFVEAPGAFHEILQEVDDVRAIFWREFDALAEKAAPRKVTSRRA